MTSAQKMWCDNWCRAHASSWQVLNRSQWQTVHAKSLVRFVEEVSLREEEITLLLEYLASADCIATLQLYDQTIGAEWKPIRAWIELSNKSHGNIHAVRLYHGLRTDDGELEEMYFVEDGCAYKVWTTYHWNEPAPPPAVKPSSSGVSYAISSVSRDPDTGLYSWVEQKRERVQQDIEEYLTKRTVYAEARVEEHFGVKASRVDSTGKEASVGGGTIVERHVSKNSDCTSDVRNVTTKDLPVAGSSVSEQMTLHGLNVRTESRNQPSPPETPTRVGDSVQYTKTDSGLYNVSSETAGRTPAGKIAESCAHTAHEHSHSETVNKAEMEPAETVFEIGRILHKSSSLNSNGTADVTEREQVAKPCITIRTWYDGKGRHTHCAYRNQPEPLYPVSAEGSSTAHFSHNDFGLFDGSYHIHVAYDWGRGASASGAGGGAERIENVNEDRWEYSFDSRGRHWKRKITLQCKVGYSTFGKYLSHLAVAKKNFENVPEKVANVFQETCNPVGNDYDGDGRIHPFFRWKITMAGSVGKWRRDNG